MQKRKLFMTFVGFVIISTVCLACSIIFSKKTIPDKLTRDYAFENGFLVNKTKGISSYHEISKLLIANDIEIMDVTRDKPIVLSDEDTAKLIDFFIKGAKSQELGIKEPGWLESLSSDYAPELERVLKVQYLILPLLNAKDTERELVIALMAFGDQLCQYDDMLISLIGLACKSTAIEFLIENDPGTEELLIKKYLELKAEIQSDIETVRNN